MYQRFNYNYGAFTTPPCYAVEPTNLDLPCHVEYMQTAIYTPWECKNRFDDGEVNEYEEYDGYERANKTFIQPILEIPVPEVMVEWIQEPIMVKNPITGKKQKVGETKVPRHRRRTTTHKIVLRVDYPNTVQSAVENRIRNCAILALNSARATISGGWAAASASGGAAIAALIAAAASKAYGEFWACLKSYSGTAAVLTLIKIKIAHEEKSTPWS